MRGTPSASMGRARGPRDASGYAVHGRVTPHHMTTVPSYLPFSSGIKVTTPGNRGLVFSHANRLVTRRYDPGDGRLCLRFSPSAGRTRPAHCRRR